MVSDAVFNLFVNVMFWSAAGIFALAMALMVLLLMVRIRAIARRRHMAHLLVLWRAIFTGKRPNVRRRIARRDVFAVLNLWNDFYRVRSESAGVSEEHLRAVAIEQQFDVFAARMLVRGDAPDKLVALAFMGFFPLESSREHIRASAAASLGEVSLAAFRALVTIDVAEVELLANALATRDDYRPRTVEQLLKAIGPDIVSTPMVNQARTADAAMRRRLVRYFPLLDPATVHPALADFLNEAEDADAIAALLRALAPVAQASDLPLVRRFLTHPASFVRVAAIGALVPICEAPDRETLLGLLNDRDSWVRYRAAQTLLDCFAHEGTEGDLRREVADQYARDALTQVLAERSVVELREFVAEETGQVAEVTVEGMAAAERRPMDEMRAV